MHEMGEKQSSNQWTGTYDGPASLRDIQLDQLSLFIVDTYFDPFPQCGRSEAMRGFLDIEELIRQTTLESLWMSLTCSMKAVGNSGIES